MSNKLRTLALATSLACLAGSSMAGTVSIDFDGLVVDADGKGDVSNITVGAYKFSFSSFEAFDDNNDKVGFRRQNSGHSIFIQNKLGTNPTISLSSESGASQLFKTLIFDYGLIQSVEVVVSGSKGSSSGAYIAGTTGCFLWSSDTQDSCGASSQKPGGPWELDISAFGEIETITFKPFSDQYFTIDNFRLVPAATDPGNNVPEPASLALTLAALLGAGAASRRRLSA